MPFSRIGPTKCTGRLQLQKETFPLRLVRFAYSAPTQVDNRVRFIAESIFNLITVTWNRDSRDWAIPYLFDQTVEKSIDEVRSYVNGSKTPGLNILEHELNDECVSVFEGVYGDYVSNGWDIRNLVSCGRGFVRGSRC